MVQFDLTQTDEQILQAIVDSFKVSGTSVKDEDLMIVAKKLTPYLHCPAKGNKRVIPIACQMCMYGHMTECHYPKLCREANCCHHQQQIALEKESEGLK